MAEVAPVAVGAPVAGENHPANLRLVARVPDHRPKLRNAVSELALLSVRTRPGLLPFVTKLRLEHPLIVNLQLQAARFFLFLAYTGHIHPLLQPRRTLSNPKSNNR